MSNSLLTIDIGSTKISAMVADVEADGSVHILGHGVNQTQGVKKGVITNIELASRSIKQAVTEAKRASGIGLTSATVSISNAYAKSVYATGILNLPQKEIGIKEINRAMQTALYNANIPSEYEVIHVLPYNFKVDEQDMVEDPYGMNASRMEVEVNIIMTQKSGLSNLKKAVRTAGIEIDGLVLGGYASSIAVVTEEEKQMGAAVIDIGGQTSNLVVHVGNAIRYNDFIGVGSNHVTNDLSVALHTPLQVAEEVKIRYGIAPIDTNESIELPILGDDQQTKNVSLELVHSVMYARVEETLMLLANSLRKSGLFEHLSGGVVFTGGMTKLQGFYETAQQIFPTLSVRIGKPPHPKGLFDEFVDPTFSTVIGLLLYRAGRFTEYEIDFKQEMLHSKAPYAEDLSDIRLGGGSETKVHDESQGASSPDAPSSKEPKNEASTISLDEFPKLADEEINPIQKLTNWVKHLF